MGKILISVVVPVYQIRDYLDKCISSIIEQSYKNLEIILVDDGSTDGSGELCDRYQEKDPRIRVIHKEHVGTVSTRKRGVNSAAGQYIVCVDGDDWIEADFIEKFAGYLTDGDFDIIWGIAYYKDYKDSSRLVGKYDIDESQLMNPEVQKSLFSYVSGQKGFQNDLVLSLCMRCFRREFLKDIQNSVDDRITFDEDFTGIVRCLAMQPKICFVRNDGYHYLQRDNSVTRQKDLHSAGRIMLEDTLRFIDRVSPHMQVLKNYVRQEYIVSQVQYGNINLLQKEGVDTIIPFRNAKKGKRVLLYGAGNVGKKIANYLFETKECTVVGFVDEMQRDTGRLGIPCYKLSDIERLQFDYVLISTIKMEYIVEIRKALHDYGISEDRVAYLDTEVLDGVGGIEQH